MPNLRQATIPFDHLLAELAAFPLASVDALEIGCTELEPTLQGRCGLLWRRAENKLAASFPNTSLDEMFGVRDRLWFDKPSKFPRPLHDYLWLLSYHALEAHGATAVPRPMFRPLPEERGDLDRAVLGRDCWRWLTLALPPDLLLAGLSCSDSFPSVVTSLPPRLERLLVDEGFAESHQHFGAGLDFAQLWVAAVRRVTNNEFRMDSLASPGADFDDGRGLAPWLLRAAVLRVVLAAYLRTDEGYERAPPPTLVLGAGETATLEVSVAADAVQLLAMQPSPTSDAEMCQATLEVNGREVWRAPLPRRPRASLAYEGVLAPLVSQGLCTLRLKRDPGSGRPDEQFSFLVRRAARKPWSFARFLRSGLKRVEILVGSVGAHVLRRAIEETLRGRIASGPREHAELRALYRRWGARAVPWIDRVDQVQWADPMARFFPPRAKGQITCEMQFITEALHHMAGKGSDDVLFAQLFWQVQRVRNLVYRHVVQRPMTPGLLWFVRTYDRLSPLRRGFGDQRKTMTLSLRAAAHLAGAGHGLRSFEARTAPSASPAEMLDLVRHAALVRHELAEAEPRCSPAHVVHAPDPGLRQPQTPASCEFGLVLHVIRARGGNLDKGRLIAHVQRGHADPATLRPAGRGRVEASRDGGAGVRFARLYRQRRREVACLGALLLEFPRAIEVVRGVDVCTDELGVPIWVVAPFFRYLRQAGDLAVAFLHDALSSEVPPPRATAHAGEDFVHLVGGLRRIDESVRYLKLRAGDRLGHGLALGVDAREWAQAHGPLAVHKEERLLDLAWEWGLYADRGVIPQLGRAMYLEHEIARLSYEVFGTSLTPYEVHQFVGDLHNERTLRAIGFPDRVRAPDEHERAARATHDSPRPHGDRPCGSVRLERLRTYLTDSALFDRGHSLEWVDPHQDGEVLASLQSHLRRRLGSLGITVEVNPSSNLLVGNLGDLERHPLWRLNPPPGLGPAEPEPPVAICVGSDDPMTFATSLPEEYGRLYDALLLAGGKDEEILRWLDGVRRAGLQTRFTLPRSRTPIDGPRRLVDKGRCDDQVRLTSARGLRLHRRIKPLP